MNSIQSMGEILGNKYLKPITRDLVIFRSAVNDIIAQDFLKIKKNLLEETIKHFHLGYDVYRNYITIPDVKNGEVVNVAFRSLDDGEKEKYFKQKGCESWIFNERGLEVAKKMGGVLITSNQFDCMSAWQVGIKNVVSVPVGKDGIGLWMELFKSIPKIYIAFENNKASKKLALNLADRIGSDRCFEIELPKDYQDLSSYFKKYTADDLKDLIRLAKPYYRHRFNNLKDVIDSIREHRDDFLTLKCLPPFLEIEEGWTMVLSGDSGIGKTSMALNITNELINRDIPVLFLPIEEGIKAMGKRFLQVKYHKTKQEVRDFQNEDWEKIIPEVGDLPLYFSRPSSEEVNNVIDQAKRYFGVKFVIVDHLDLLVRNSDSKNINTDTAKAVQNFVSLGQAHNIIFLLLHHINKPAFIGLKSKKPKKEDLKGTSTIYQDAKAVIMLSYTDGDNKKIEIDIVKNKGEEGSRIYDFNVATGVVGADSTDIYKSPAQKALADF